MSTAGKHYDARETRDPVSREAALFSRLPDVLRHALAGATVLRAEDDEIRWTVMADPEGNEFCVLGP